MARTFMRLSHVLLKKWFWAFYLVNVPWHSERAHRQRLLKSVARGGQTRWRLRNSAEIPTRPPAAGQSGSWQPVQAARPAPFRPNFSRTCRRKISCMLSIHRSMSPSVQSLLKPRRSCSQTRRQYQHDPTSPQSLQLIQNFLKNSAEPNRNRERKDQWNTLR